jgi:hypothetical protein
VQYCPTIPQPKFDKKYKTIIQLDYDHDYLDVMDWINIHSKDSVDVEVITSGFDVICVFFAFENEDDALVFKIKYSK